MRAAGVSLIAATVAAALAPWPLGLLLVLAVAIVCGVGGLVARHDRVEQERAARENAAWARYVGPLREADETEFEALYSATHRFHFSPDLKRGRLVPIRVPGQRSATEAS